MFGRPAAATGCCNSAAVPRAGMWASDRRRRREEATARAVGLLATPVLAVAAHLHFPERHRLIELVEEVAAGRLLHLTGRKLDAVGDATTMGAVDRADKMPVG